MSGPHWDKLDWPIGLIPEFISGDIFNTSLLKKWFDDRSWKFLSELTFFFLFLCKHFWKFWNTEPRASFRRWRSGQAHALGLKVWIWGALLLRLFNHPSPCGPALIWQRTALSTVLLKCILYWHRHTNLGKELFSGELFLTWLSSWHSL